MRDEITFEGPAPDLGSNHKFVVGNVGEAIEFHSRSMECDEDFSHFDVGFDYNFVTHRNSVAGGVLEKTGSKLFVGGTSGSYSHPYQNRVENIRDQIIQRYEETYDQEIDDLIIQR